MTAPVPPGALAPPAGAEAWGLVMELFLQGEARSRLHQVCRSVGLPVNVVKALLSLDREPPLAMGELARTFDADASYCTSLVDSLESYGVARRQAHPTDRRVKTVVLTPEGRRVLAETRSKLDEPPSAFLSLAEDDQRALRDLLAKVVAADPVLAADS